MCLDIFAVDGASSGDNCSYQYLLNYLNLTSKNELYYMSRPVKNHSTTTTVNLDMLTYAILDMVSFKFVCFLVIIIISLCEGGFLVR